MSSNLKKSVYFLTPVLIVILFPFVVFIYCGEFVSAKKIMEKQLSGKPVLYGKLLPSVGGEYSKLELLKLRKPDIITLGNSRVLQIRKKFFRDDVIFFNGGGIAGLANYRKTFEKISSEELPDYVIVGLEQSYFSTNSEKNEVKDLVQDEIDRDFFMGVLNGWRNFYTHLLDGRYSFNDFFSFSDYDVEKIGVRAKIKNFGIKNDGSSDYGNYLKPIYDPTNEDYKFKDTLRRIEKGSNLFFKGDKVSDESISVLNEFLQFCDEKKIYVIGFLPPYAQEIYAELKKNGGYQYIFEMDKALKPIFENYNYSFFDYTDMISFGAPREEIIDGIHASEKAYLRLFIDMAEKDDRLGELVDIEFLKKRLKTENGNYNVFAHE